MVGIHRHHERGVLCMSKRRRLLAGFVLVVASLVLSLGLLSVLDHVLARRNVGYVDLWQDKPTLSTLDFYPYSGHHIQAHFHQRGPDIWNDQDFDIRSGDHGFFVDFPLDRPPPKAANEFRLILIGGSAAQGFGGRTNDDMFYRLLERKVNMYLASQMRHETIRIINLAMGGSISYQNFVALNLWGHALEPDAILSFSGFNEFSMYKIFGSNLYNHGAAYGGLSLAQRHWESQGWQKFLAKLFPSIFRTSNTALALRTLALPQRAGRFVVEYASRFPHEDAPIAAARFQAHALLSILRDFPDAPLLLVTQPYQGADASYDEAQLKVVEILMSSTMSHRVSYLNSHALWKANDYFPGSLVDAVHLSNAGQERIAEYLAEPVTRLMAAARTGEPSKPIVRPR